MSKKVVKSPTTNAQQTFPTIPPTMSLCDDDFHAYLDEISNKHVEDRQVRVHQRASERSIHIIAEKDVIQGLIHEYEKSQHDLDFLEHDNLDLKDKYFAFLIQSVCENATAQKTIVEFTIHLGEELVNAVKALRPGHEDFVFAGTFKPVPSTAEILKHSGIQSNQGIEYEALSTLGDTLKRLRVQKTPVSENESKVVHLYDCLVKFPKVASIWLKVAKVQKMKDTIKTIKPTVYAEILRKRARTLGSPAAT